MWKIKEPNITTMFSPWKCCDITKTYWFGAEKLNISNFGCITYVVNGKNKINQSENPVIIPKIIPRLRPNGINLFQNIAPWPSKLPAIVPAAICNKRPTYGDVLESWNPKENPITAKKVPEGVFEMKSMLNNNPDITMDANNPANVQ